MPLLGPVLILFASKFNKLGNAGMFTKSDKDMRSIRSMDFSDRRRAGSYRQKQEPARVGPSGSFEICGLTASSADVCGCSRIA